MNVLPQFSFILSLSFLLSGCAAPPPWTIQREDPEAKTLYRSALNHYAQGRWESAITILGDIIDMPRARLLFARSRFFNGEEEEGIAMIRKLYRENPHYFEAGYWLARLLELGREEQQDEAVQIARYLLDLNPEQWSLHLLIALSEIKKGRIDTALSRLEYAVRQKEQLARCYLWLGRLYKRLKRREEAVKALNRGIESTDRGRALYKELLAEVEGIYE